MILPGTKDIMHENPKYCDSWDIHGEEGWYIGPALHHYRCYQCYCTSTNCPPFLDTVEFYPTVVEVPHPSSVDVAIQAALDFYQTLRHPPLSLIILHGLATVNYEHFNCWKIFFAMYYHPLSLVRPKIYLLMFSNFWSLQNPKL